MKIQIKPLSVNEMYRGKKFKSVLYLRYKQALLPQLDRTYKVPEGLLELHFTFGLSNQASDYDNLIKPTQDCICDYYGINDKNIYYGTQRKIIVPKGEEYIEFQFLPFKSH